MWGCRLEWNGSSDQLSPKPPTNSLGEFSSSQYKQEKGILLVSSQLQAVR
jgi:hypothetical protein